MKDTQLKTSPIPLMPKSKIGIKKEKMAAKKIKEQKTPVLKASSSKKGSLKSPVKKCNNSKEVEDPPKRKRGRPRNEDRIQNKKKVIDPKPGKKIDEVASCRKRKLSQNVVKTEKEFIHPPLKKPKINDTNCNMNGNIKMPVSTVHKPCIQKGESPTVVEHTITNSNNSNGTVHCKKTLMFGTKKPAVSSVTKNSLFPTTAKKEMVNGNGWVKQCKNQLTKNNKSIPKKMTEVNNLPKDCAKDVKVEKVNNIITPYEEPVKSQRMASLDALAKMHVICTTDRKPIEHHPKTTSVITVCSQPFSHQKSLTQCHESIRFDVKKESKDCKGNIVHKQINYVKEKQQVFVSHSVEQSSVLEHKEQTKPLSAKSQLEKDKKKKTKTSQNSPPAATETGKSAKLKKNVSNNLKFLEILPKKGGASKSKSSKEKEDDKKSMNNKNKTPKIVKKTFKDKQDNKGNNKAKKVEQTKSEVKVKETIRMQKTCTYQSVTTVNSHGTTDSICVPVSHVGMTTNFSKTEKTVVTDEECKNKINYSSGSVINNTYCLTSESPCSVSHHTDCCKFHSHTTPQIIPFAHVQTCPIGHSMVHPSTSGSSSSSSSHCDGNSAVHRFSQPPVVYSPPSSDYGCCCSGSLVQNVHDSCFLRNSIVPYPHHHSHHTHHIPTSAFSSETLCTDCHRPSNTSLEASRHVQHFGLSSSSHSRIGCCSCCELVRESNQLHHQSTGSCLQYLSSSKNSASLVPCEQSPLDLSLASTSSSASVDPDFSLPTGHCPSPFCCRDLLLLRTSTPHGFQQNTFSPNKGCCRCAKQVICEKPNVETVKKVQCSNTTVKQLGQPHQSVDHVALLTSPVGKESVIPPNVSASGATSKSVPHVLTDNLVTTKREKNTSPKQSAKVSLIKKRHFSHGWSWKGEPRERLIALTNDSIPCPRTCYPSIQHKEGDTINEKDCVLLRSGPKDTDLPYVAKVAAFWENPEDGEMMMSLLWYYRPEHTEQGRKPGQMEDEVFASRHKDVNSVACIEDKCYVLTYNEYCRYRASLSMDDDMISMASVLVPDLVDGYPRKDRLPNDVVSSDIVFFCRHVYDFRQKRILKNPS